MDHDTGVFTGKIIRLISDIRAKHGKDSVNLSNCCKFTLAEDLSDISDMTSIDLSSIGSLEGGVHLQVMFFPQAADRAQLLKKNSLRILREFSRVARRTRRKFLEFSSLNSNSLLPCLLVNPHPSHTSSLFFMLLFPQGSLKTSRRLVIF